MDRRIKRSRQQEKDGARRWGGQQHAGSGSGRFKKNDWHTKDHLVEAKCRADPKARQITIKLDDLLGVERQALIEGRCPVLQFELAGRTYVIHTEEDYLEKRDLLAQLMEAANGIR